MEFELHDKDSDSSDRVIRVAAGASVVLGRSEECDLQLPDPGVSRHHCRLEHAGDHLHVVDLDSANGTWVDGERLESDGRLSDGSELGVGPVTMACRAEGRKAPEGRPGARTSRVSWSESDSQTVYRKVIDTESPWRVTEGAEAARELEELRRAHSHFGTAYRVSKLLARHGDLDGLLQGVLEAVFSSIDADRAAVLLRPDADRDGSDADGDDPDELAVVAARERDDTGDEEEVPEITVSRTVISDVLENGVSTLSRDASADARFRGAESVIAQKIRSVVCSPLATDEETLGVLYADSHSVVSAFTESEVELLALIGNQAGLAIHRARLMRELERFFFDTIRAIVATIDAKDGYTHRHSERVAAFGTRIAREAGVDEGEELKRVHLSGLLHDIGKIGVPDAILNKTGRLTDEEFEEVKKHPAHGEDILRHIQNPRFEAILPGVRCHHEKWDGSGYPDGLAGDSIPYLGRVLAVADVLDALTSDRSYRDANTLDETVEIILSDAGSHFDPELAEAAASLHERGELEVAPTDVGPPGDGARLSDPSDAIDALSAAAPPEV